MVYELAIIGAGPAGCSAAIYAIRAGINTIVFDKALGGGLSAVSPNIENYLGFESISGIDFVERMKNQVSKYTNLNLNEEVRKINKKNNLFDLETTIRNYNFMTVLLCMGTEYRKLQIPGEKEFQGKGVSYCATCDGFFFKDKKVAVIGGGNSALVEAIYLKQIKCDKVYLIHRRDQLRAEKAYEKEAIEKGVHILYNTHVESIIGKNKVENLKINNVKTSEKSLIEVDGIFVSIGEEPQNFLARNLGLKLDEKGYILTDKEGRTSLKGVYAAGDITGGLRQVITAAAEGAVAALATTEIIGKKYPY
jgi:thioredoxin reductase (NADPH)